MNTISSTLVVLTFFLSQILIAQQAIPLIDQVFELTPFERYMQSDIKVVESDSIWYAINFGRIRDTNLISKISIYDLNDNLIKERELRTLSGEIFSGVVESTSESDPNVIRLGAVVYSDRLSARSMAYSEYNLAIDSITKSYEWPNTLRQAFGDPYFEFCPDCNVIHNDTLFFFDWLNTLDASDSNYVADLFVIDLSNGEIVRHFEYDNESQGQFNWFTPVNGVFYKDGFLYGGEGLDLQRLNTVTGKMDTSQTQRLYRGFSNLELLLPGFGEWRSFFLPQDKYYYWQNSQTYHVTVGDSLVYFNPEATGIALSKISAQTLEVVDSIHFLREENIFPFDFTPFNISPLKTSSAFNNICAQGDFLYGLVDGFQDGRIPRIAVWKVDTATFSLVWERYYDLPFDGGVFGYSVSPQPSGAILVNGTAQGTLEQPWFYRLDADGNPLQVSSSFEIATRPVLNLNVFPNPTSQQLNLQLMEHEATTAITKVSLVNNTGQVVQEIDRGALIGAASSETLTIDVSALPPGTYFVRIAMSDGEWLAKPVVVQR